MTLESHLSTPFAFALSPCRSGEVTLPLYKYTPGGDVEGLFNPSEVTKGGRVTINLQLHQPKRESAPTALSPSKVRAHFTGCRLPSPELPY